MRKVDRMTLDPAHCLICGAGNVEDEHGNIGPFVDTQVEVGWGDSVYICPLCVHWMATAFGYASAADVAEKDGQIKRQKKQIFNLKAKVEEKQRRVDAIREGKRAIRAEKEEAVA